ncbi:MAG: winged helix DNA-binding domain-containing protein, partial [bacterium]|nr:winged helix DNA-binding domain-containing protein [bacterium]
MGLAARIEEVAVDGWPGPLYSATEGEEAHEMGSGVTALPLLDPYVQGYRDRGRFLDPTRHAFVYDGGGNATATLVRRGRIIGVWQLTEEPAESVRYHLHRRSGLHPPSRRGRIGGRWIPLLRSARRRCRGSDDEATQRQWR